MNSTTKPKQPVEGGGVVGGGCGLILGAALAFFFLMPISPVRAVMAGVIALVFGVLGWRLGDSFFERVLDGDPEGKPLRYWFWWW